MLNQTETFNFSQLPLRISGNAIVAHVSGQAIWQLAEDGYLQRLLELTLDSSDGRAEVLPSEDIYAAVHRALAGAAKERVNQRRREPEVLDNTVTEGAPSPT